MKTLVVYDSMGNIIFTQSNANDRYYIETQDIGHDKIVIGIDLETKDIIAVDSFLSYSERVKRMTELSEKNKEYLLKNELEESKKTNDELNAEIKAEIQKLKNANTEIIEYINVVTGITGEE
jgi:hypothetical protein|nr:MAG TPA: hypothetical protein [Caudoviricetes sp.]